MGADITDWLTWAVALLPAVLWYVWSKVNDAYYKVWEKRGIRCLPSSFPWGTSMHFSREVKFQGFEQQKMYNKFKGYPYFGFYFGAKPFLMLRDPEYVQLILTKDFSHFRDRQGMEMPDNDPLQHHLFNLEGDKWRALRVKMTPVFTSGKLKGMFEHFVKCSEDLNEFLLRRAEQEVDVKETTARFSTDVICSCAFGWEVKALGEEESSLRKMGKEFMEFKLNPLLNMKLNLIKYIPPLTERPMPKILKDNIEKFMLDAVKSTVEGREKTGQKRNDFIDLLIQIKKKGLALNEEDEVISKGVEPIELTNELMTAQCFVFFLAGFETSSSVMSFCLHELSLNHKVQERLHKEIVETIEKHGGLTYQAIKEMEYLDMVVSETMRKYPTLTFLTRRAVSSYTLPDGAKLERGDRIFIPLWSIHRDPENYPDPEVWDPERFSPENKHLVRPYTYLPFGEGPRICIGSRFGLLQTKIGILTVVRRFSLSPAGDASLEFDGKSPILTRTSHPILLKLSRRQ